MPLRAHWVIFLAARSLSHHDGSDVVHFCGQYGHDLLPLNTGVSGDLDRCGDISSNTASLLRSPTVMSNNPLFGRDLSSGCFRLATCGPGCCRCRPSALCYRIAMPVNCSCARRLADMWESGGRDDGLLSL